MMFVFFSLFFFQLKRIHKKYSYLSYFSKKMWYSIDNECPQYLLLWRNKFEIHIITTRSVLRQVTVARSQERTCPFWRPLFRTGPDLLPITYKCIRLQLQLLCNFMITDYYYNYIFPECNQLQSQLHCNVIDYNYNYFLIVPCFKKI